MLQTQARQLIKAQQGLFVLPTVTLIRFVLKVFIVPVPSVGRITPDAGQIAEERRTKMLGRPVSGPSP